MWFESDLSPALQSLQDANAHLAVIYNPHHDARRPFAIHRSFGAAAAYTVFLNSMIATPSEMYALCLVTECTARTMGEKVGVSIEPWGEGEHKDGEEHVVRVRLLGPPPVDSETLEPRCDPVLSGFGVLAVIGGSPSPSASRRSIKRSRWSMTSADVGASSTPRTPRSNLTDVHIYPSVQAAMVKGKVLRLGRALIRVGKMSTLVFETRITKRSAHVSSSGSVLSHYPEFLTVVANTVGDLNYLPLLTDVPVSPERVPMVYDPFLLWRVAAMPIQPIYVRSVLEGRDLKPTSVYGSLFLARADNATFQARITVLFATPFVSLGVNGWIVPDSASIVDSSDMEGTARGPWQEDPSLRDNDHALFGYNMPTFANQFVVCHASSAWAIEHGSRLSPLCALAELSCVGGVHAKV